MGCAETMGVKEGERMLGGLLKVLFGFRHRGGTVRMRPDSGECAMGAS